MNFEFIKKHSEFFTIFGLCTAFYFIFFFGIGSYPLMDIDETRYASMAHDMFRSKDFMTLYLNGEYFFEKPPLYFWLECLSFGLFGKVNEFTVRFPVSMFGFLFSFLLYFVGNKIISRKFGVISSLILATSAEFFILSKFAILDIVLCFCTTFSIFFGFMTLFCEEKNKKYFWWLFYIFSGLAVLAKGIPGFVLPFGTMFFAYIASKKFKELFKPLYFIPGTLIFLAIVLPWHIVMLKMHDPAFFNEYIMKHHIARFTTSAELGRKQPFYFFILTILVGFFPWIIPAVTTCKNWLTKVANTFKEGFDFEKFDNTKKFITLNAIASLLILCFFSSSSSKLITYMLPIYPFLACLAATIFMSDENKKALDITSILFGIAMLITGIVLPFLPSDVYSESTVIEFPLSYKLIVPAVFIFPACFMINAKNIKNGFFSSIVLLMILLSAIGNPIAFNIDFMYGQNDLMKYAKMAKENGNQLSSFGFGRRFSLNYYYQKHVIYGEQPSVEALNNLLNDKNTVIVVKNADLKTLSEISHFQVIETGIKYSLIKG